jgi:uncharacterized UPF0160 family protein
MMHENNQQKIVTHNGIFHCDEIFAIEIIKKFIFKGNESLFQLERKSHVTDEELEDLNTFVLDIGGTLDATKGNFDHHQDANLPCTAVLVGAYYIPREYDLYSDNILEVIDYNDRGVEVNKNATLPQFVSYCNEVENGFELARNACQNFLDVYLENAMTNYENRKKFKNLSRALNGYVVCNLNNYISNWKSLAEKEGILFSITKNSRDEHKFSLISRNSDIIQVPQGLETCEFRHYSGFMGVFSTYEDTINAAKKALSNNGYSI